MDGQGFVPDSTVTVVITDADGNEIGTIEGVEVDGEGNFTVDWTVPEGTDPGELTITATDDEDPEVNASGTVTVTDEDGVIVDPTITAEPAVVNIGEDLTVTGEGYVPGSTVVVDFSDVDGNVYDSVEGVSVDQDGTFTITWTVSDSVAPGALVITGTDESDPTIWDVTAVAVTDEAADVEDPSISIEPQAVNPGEDVTVSGEGFTPGTTVTIEITDADGNVIGVIEGVEVGDDGTFTVDWTVPEDTVPCIKVVTATDDNDPDVSASSVFKVNDEADQIMLSISVEHPVLTHGDTQIGYASGYEPGTEVEGFMNSNLHLELGTEVADEDGNVTFTWEIPEGADVGAHTFSVTAEDYPDQGVAFLVIDDAAAGADEDGAEDGSGTGTADPAGDDGKKTGPGAKPDSDLARTGVDGGLLAALAALALLLGSAAVVFAKRSHRSSAE
ncbi:hypothetical protein GCM10009674_11440 [Nesterenkonia xinjiangensis]